MFKINKTLWIIFIAIIGMQLQFLIAIQYLMKVEEHLSKIEKSTLISDKKVK